MRKKEVRIGLRNSFPVFVINIVCVNVKIIILTIDNNNTNNDLKIILKNIFSLCYYRFSANFQRRIFSFNKVFVLNLFM